MPRACLALAAAVLLAGCVTDLRGLRPDPADQAFTVVPTTPPNVFVSADGFRGHRRHPETSRLLEARIESSLRELGVRIVDSPADADFTLTADLRGWWARSARFALVTLATLTVYTPLDYKWILDVDVADREGNPIGSVHERGGFRFDTFGIVIFPATIYAYYELVVPHWRQLTIEAAALSSDFLVARLASPDAPSP